MRGALLLAVFAAFAAGTAASQTEPADDGARWRWLIMPDYADIGLALGDKASSSAKPGAVGVVECAVAANGRLIDCVTVEETPGSRMGAAVTAIAKFYKASRLDQQGEPTVGRRTRLAFALGGRYY